VSKTAIEYVDETWNPVTGCTKVSAGCENCYAERMARRLAGRFGYPEAPHHFDVTLHPERLDEPLKRGKSTRYLVCSMGDIAHMAVPLAYQLRMWATMMKARQHTFLLLTKRPQQLGRIVDWLKVRLQILGMDEEPLPNVWPGVTVESQDEMWRVEELVKIPGARHWVSAEPCLSALDFTPWLDQLDWVILGGETGPGARPMHPDWARRVRDDCVAADTDFFFKNWGGWHPAVWLTECGDIAVISAEHDNSEDIFGDGQYMLPVPRGSKSGRVLDGRKWNEIPGRER